MSQAYVTRVHEIDVIVGNSGLLKCEIPSFVIDFVAVVSWIDNDGSEHFIKPRRSGKNKHISDSYHVNSMGHISDDLTSKQ